MRPQPLDKKQFSCSGAEAKKNIRDTGKARLKPKLEIAMPVHVVPDTVVFNDLHCFQLNVCIEWISTLIRFAAGAIYLRRQ